MSQVTKGEERGRKAFQQEYIAPLSYSVNGAAAAIGVSRATIWRLIQAGELATFKLGARTLIQARVLEAFIAQKAAA